MEEVRDYFPTEVVRGVAPSSERPVSLRLSTLLEGFQQLLRGCEALRKEGMSLEKQGRLYEELVRRNKVLEEKLSRQRGGLVLGGPGSLVLGGRGTDLFSSRGWRGVLHLRGVRECWGVCRVGGLWQ